MLTTLLTTSDLLSTPVNKGVNNSAGQTIAIGGAVAALVITVVSRRSIPGVIFFSLIALIVTIYALTVMESAGELLLDRLDLVAETARLK